ncbi:MAG: alkaline phosphatase family protein [Candidatus Binatia bacterium]
MSLRTVILGLDGVTFDIVDPLVAAGRMPTLARLIRDGVRAPLGSTVPPVSAPAWVTFLTGKHPGKHGVFNFQNLDARRYSGFSETLVNSSFFRGTTLLDHLGTTTEVRSLAYRVPMTFPPWDVRNGVVIAGPPVPDRQRPYARPRTVEAEIGRMASLSTDEVNRAKENRDVAAVDAGNRFELDLLERVTRRYLANGTDLVIAFTGIADTLHHYFWAFHDPTFPTHEPGAPEPLRTVITRAYEAIDATLGRILEGLDPAVAVMIVSDHGGGPQPVHHVNFNALLRQAGYLTPAGGGRAQVATGMGRLVDEARRRLPWRAWLKRNLPEIVQGRLRGLRNATGAVAWERTRAYAVPVYYPITGVWVNLQGRQPKGVVAPGAEYERLRGELIERLRGLRHPETDAPLVVGVWRREEVFTGPHAEDAPDLVVETAAGYHGGIDLDRLVTAAPASALRQVSGSHTRDGIFVAAGGPFRRGVTLDHPNLADVLPTGLHLVGAALPDDLDGRVLGEALDPAWLAAHPVQTTARQGGENGREALSEDDEAEMRKFLQGLGYVE